MRVETIGDATLLTGDCLDVMRGLPDESVQCCITSPPYYGLRDYKVDGQIGLEPTPDEYVARLVEVFHEVRRVLADEGVLFLNAGDSYNSGPSGGLGGSTLQGGQDSQSQSNRAWRNGSGRADGVVDDRAQRNRNGINAAGLKSKDLIGIPWMIAFALRTDGWWLRQDIIWSKPNCMPESVQDRCTKSHEYIFLLSKSARYYFDQAAIAEPLASNPESWGRHSKKDPGLQATTPRPMFGADRDGRDGTEFGNGTTRNKRSVWTVPSASFSGAHFSTYPPDLIRPCVMAGCPSGGTILDPFSGSGTTGMVAMQEGRKYIGIELNPEYQALAVERITPHAAQNRLFA